MRILGCDYPDSLLYDREGALWAKKEGEEYRIGFLFMASYYTK